MLFDENDKHGLPSRGIGQVPEEEQIEPFYFPNQEYLAKVIVERIIHIVDNNAKKIRDSDPSREGIFFLEPLAQTPTSTSFAEKFERCYNGFEFVIYTAISNMLELQTAKRVADKDSGVFSKEFTENSSRKELRQKALGKVGKYHVKTIKMHQRLVDKVKDNPRTLFLIVADEAHVAVTKRDNEGQGPNKDTSESDVEAKRANDTLVNYWKDDEHPNVVVLQVGSEWSSDIATGLP